MGVSRGRQVSSTEFRIAVRNDVLVIVAPCGERVNLKPDEARKLANRVKKAAKASEQMLAAVIPSQPILA